MHNTEKLLDLTSSDFAELFATTEEKIMAYCGDSINHMDFHYQKIEGEQRDELILDILNAIDAGNLTVSGKERKDTWEKGWSQNFQKFIENNQDLSSLVPAYMWSYKILRLNCNYIKPLNPDFLLDFYTIYRRYFLGKYLSDYEFIYEFGCGTGFNLVIISQLFPEKSIHGADWAMASKELVDKIAHAHNYNIKGHVFDMFSPNKNFSIADNSAIVTLNSLEQIGENHEHFIQFIIEKVPAICINFEPLVELYDENNLMDYLAIKYHKKRGYLDGYLTRLRKLESEGEIEILKTQRIHFGTLYHEAYSLVVWRPKR